MSIGFSIELLEKNYDELSFEKREKYYKNIRSSIEDLNSLLEGIVFINRSKQGGVPIERSSVNINLYLSDVIEYFKQFSNDRIRFHSKIQAAKSYLLDIKLLRNIVYNLVSNALKYSSEEVIIQIEEYQASLEIQIQDFGIGIPEDEKDKLFSLFFRARNVGKVEGIGLGLNIVKQSVEALDGYIKVETEEDKGATFTVLLPIKY